MARPFPYTPPSQRSGGADLNQQQRLAPEKAAVRSDLAEEQDIVEYWKGLAIYTPPIPDHPPVDGAGEWVERRNFDGEKSFGFFICDCGRYWLTAHCYRDYKQGCKWCEKESLSYYMWENHETDKRPRRAKRYGDKPHDEQRCEACRRGECDFCAGTMSP